MLRGAEHALQAVGFLGQPSAIRRDHDDEHVGDQPVLQYPELHAMLFTWGQQQSRHASGDLVDQDPRLLPACHLGDGRAAR